MVRTTRAAFLHLTFVVLTVLITLTGLARTTLAAQISLQTVDQGRQSHFSPRFLPLTKFHLRGIDGPYHTQGNLILGSDNYPYLFHGMARDDLEYFCRGDGHYTAKELAYLGLGNNTATETYWQSNIVRLPLSENFWLYGHPSENCSPAQYQALVKETIDALTNMNLNVLIDLEWTNAGGQAFGGGTQLAMPDADSVTFWKQVA